MAPVPATLDISFVSNFVGQHRICWRIPPAIVYDCSTIVTCLGNGANCSAQILITVDNESCDPVTYEGYVQAACEDIASLNGRIPFTITFTPVPVCKSYRVSCNNVPIVAPNGATILLAGTGYDPLNPPIIAPTGGGGAGATAIAVVGSMLNILNPGTIPYAPDGTYLNIPVQTITGIGAGGFADVTILGGVVTLVTPVTTGVGYFPLDTFTFLDADLGGGGGAGFIGEWGVDYGTIILILTTGGNSYTTTPALIFPAPAAGITATAVTILDVCPDQLLGQSCDSSAGDNLTGMALNQFAMACMVALPNPPPLSNYLFSPFGCCYDCNQVSFLVNGLSPAGTLVYTDCTTHELVYVPFNPGDSIGPICMVLNSWFFTPGSIITTGVGVTCP